MSESLELVWSVGWYALVAVVAILGLLVTVVVLKVSQSCLRYHCNKHFYSSLPVQPTMSKWSLPIFETLVPGPGLEFHFKRLPRRPDGSFEPIINMRSHLNGQQFLGVTDPDLIKVMVTQTDDFVKAPIMYETVANVLLGQGLVTTAGAKWKRQRRVITPIFHFDHLRAMPDIVNKYMDQYAREVKDLYRANPNYKMPCGVSMRSLTMKVIIELAFGNDFDSKWMAEQWVAMGHAFSNYAVGMLTLGSMFHFFPIPAARKPHQIRAAICERVTQVIHERRSRMAKADSSLNDASDLLTAMLRVKDSETGKGIEMDELLDQSVTFLFAGHDTTSSLMSWVLYYLTQHKPAQQRVQKEVDSVLGKRNATNEDLENLVFTRNVLSETLRMAPPVFGLGRETSRDLELGGVKIRKGTIVMFHIWAAHHSTQHWTNPDLWDPDRWSSSDIKNLHPFAYLPFSAGPRNCVGRNFALREATLMLSHLAQHFNVEQVVDGPEDQVITGAEILMEPLNFKMRLIPRA